MRNFKEAYKETVDSILVPDFRTEEISEENRKKRIFPYRRKRYMATAAFAGGIFIIFTVGGVVAAGYTRSLARADENGSQTMDMNTAYLQEGMLLSQIGPDEGSGGISERIAEITDCEEAMDTALLEASENAAENAMKEEACLQKMSDCYAEQERIYTSPEAFTEETGILLALSGESLPGELKREEYILTGNGFLLVRLETEESVLLLHQSYYGDTSGYAAEAAYTDGVYNGRTYTTLQGFAYKLADSQDGKEIHAAIAVGAYELVLDFYGCSEEEVHNILENMDLTIYL